MNLSVVLPCLNEHKTVGICIDKVKYACDKSDLINKYEIIISDNGSIDGSVGISKSHGARVVHTKRKGYGSALLNGIRHAKYENILIADSDNTYELENLEKFIKALRHGDIVIGDRFADPDIKMSPSHYIGNKFLSFLARKLYHSDVRDFHCGMRAFKKDKLMRLNLHKTGMDFASEMICIAEKKGLKIIQISTVLRASVRPVHLNIIRDGLLHLKFLISYC